MTAYTVLIEHASAPTKVADNPTLATSEFTTYLTDNGVTISVGGGVAFNSNYYDDTDTYQVGLYAIIDANADPTTTAQAYAWDYIEAADTDDDDLAAMQTFVTAGIGAATLAETRAALYAYLHWRKVPLDYGE